MVEPATCCLLGEVCVGGIIGFLALPITGAVIGLGALGPIAGGVFAAA